MSTATLDRPRSRPAARSNFSGTISDPAALPAAGPNHVAAVGFTAFGAAGKRLRRQRPKGLPRRGCARRIRRLHHGQPGPARALWPGLQHQPWGRRHLESRDVPSAHRGGGDPHRHPPHPRRRGNRPHRADRLDRDRPLRQPERGADAVASRRRSPPARLARPGLLTTEIPAAGSLAFGAALAGSGLVFTAVAAVAAQLSPSARFARGSAFAVLGTAFTLRAVGDAGSGTLSWLSPLGWSLQVRPYAGDHFWVLLLHLATTAVLTAVAYRLLAGRDVGRRAHRRARRARHGRAGHCAASPG